MMILLCPFCGFKLHPPLNFGISSCESCKRIFDNSRQYTLLSAAWMCRRWNVDTNVVQKHCELTDIDAQIIEEYVVLQGCSHDEFLRIIKAAA
jgi:hypothetical protein